MNKGLLFLLLMACLTDCDNNSKDEDIPAKKDTVVQAVARPDTAAAYIHTFADTSLEDKITAAIRKLSFVKKSDQYIDSISNHKHGISFLLEGPAKGETEIPVQAGYNGAERFETYYRFFVNPKTLEIKVYDVVEDKKLTLKEYLKTQQ